MGCICIRNDKVTERGRTTRAKLGATLLVLRESVSLLFKLAVAVGSLLTIVVNFVETDAFYTTDPHHSHQNWWGSVH